MGFSDEAIIREMAINNRVSRDMLKALQYMAGQQGKSLTPAYDNNPDSKRMGY
jgi:hypothetical protein